MKLTVSCLRYFVQLPLSHIYRLQQAKDLREALTAKLKMATEATLTVEEKAANMHDLLTTEDQTQHALERDLKNMRDILFRKQEDLNKACRCQRELEALIQVFVCVYLLFLFVTFYWHFTMQNTHFNVLIIYI